MIFWLFPLFRKVFTKIQLAIPGKYFSNSFAHGQKSLAIGDHESVSEYTYLIYYASSESLNININWKIVRSAFLTQFNHQVPIARSCKATVLCQKLLASLDFAHSRLIKVTCSDHWTSVWTNYGKIDIGCQINWLCSRHKMVLKGNWVL